MATQLSIINAALLMVGAEQISALTDSSREARVASSIYDTTIEDVLTRHPWTFSLGQIQLAQLTATPLFGYDHAYQLPTSPKALRIMRTKEYHNDYRIFEDKLYSNRDTVEIIYQFDPGEQNYPGYFARLLEMELAKLFAFALMQDETQGATFQALANEQMRRARFINSQDSPSVEINDREFALTAVR